MIVLKGSIPISFGGTEQSAAYGELVSIGGLNPDVNKKLSAAIASILETKLSVPKSRFFLKFYDSKTISYMAERVVGTGSFGIVFQGLAYIHTVPGVCHRDVKPQNLLVFHKRMPPEAIDLASRLLQYSSSLRCTVLFLEAQFQLYISLHLHQVQSTPINPNDEEQQDFDDEDD